VPPVPAVPRRARRWGRAQLIPRPMAPEPQPMAPLPRPGASERRWQFVRGRQLGVHAVDPVGHKIGPNIGIREAWAQGMNWYPIDRFKQTLIGTVERYEFYNPAGSGDEADWNIYIRPTNDFQFIIDDALPNANPADVHRAPNGEPLIEAEITPDENFYTNPFFDDQGNSSLIGDTIGVYGPWVQDEGHGLRPEIHPSELLWWRAVNQGRATYHLMVIQDDSNRFDRRSNFTGRIVRPWSAYPRSAEFWIAVSVPDNQVQRLVVEQLFARNVRPSAPANAPQVVSRNVGTGSRVEVERQMANRRDVGVRVEPFLAAANGQSSFGYVVLECEVGNSDRGQEGYQVLRVTET
jgi:hypothetical protein